MLAGMAPFCLNLHEYTRSNLATQIHIIGLAIIGPCGRGRGVGPTRLPALGAFRRAFRNLEIQAERCHSHDIHRHTEEGLWTK